MDAQGITPRYAFGYGLSYTTFAYSSLSISPASSPSAYTVSLTVANSGSVAGTEIVQLYLGFPDSSGEPKQILRGFEEVQGLAVGESRAVSMTLTERDIRYVSMCHAPPVFQVFIWANIIVFLQYLGCSSAEMDTTNWDIYGSCWSLYQRYSPYGNFLRIQVEVENVDLN